MYSFRVILLITRGAWLKPLPARVAKEVSRLCLFFPGLQQSVHSAQRARKFSRLRSRRSSSLAIATCYRQWFEPIRLQPQRPWVLLRPQEGQCNILQDGESALRKFRESWRRFLFCRIPVQNRQGSNLLREQVVYDPPQPCKLARHLMKALATRTEQFLWGSVIFSSLYLCAAIGVITKMQQVYRTDDGWSPATATWRA